MMNSNPEPLCPRRRFLVQAGAGFTSVALSWMMHHDLVAADPAWRGDADTATPDALAPKPPHFPPRAKSVIFLVMDGGPSQIDTFDPKPELARVDGQLFARNNVRTSQLRGSRYFVRSPFRFQRYGECGLPVSELFHETAAHADKIAILRSGYGDSDNHPAALFQYTTGFPIQGNPSIGSWVVYGLGTENQDLPAFVVLRDGKPFGGNTCWGNGYLPAQYHGLQFRAGDQPVLNLQPPAGFSASQQRQTLDFVQELNRRHFEERTEFSDLAARIASYELAFRMQQEIPEATSIASETAATRQLYGLDDDQTREFGTRCLLARRLVERGVRFVQAWSGGWDSHEDVLSGQRNAARRVDRPIAGLLADLAQRGLLEETLVVWGGEFGRTADTTEAAFKRLKPGRDHNPKATLMWFAGGGVRGGTALGATDEFGDAAADERHHLRDVHATLLHLLGLDQMALTFYHGGRLKRLTDNGGDVIEGLLA